jgi:hypothetical protein
MAPRANWKGYLRLSLVSCPIALYPASSLSEKVSFNRLNRKTGNRLKQQNVDSETGEVVPREDTARGYEVAKGQYLIVVEKAMQNVMNRRWLVRGRLRGAPQVAEAAHEGSAISTCLSFILSFDAGPTDLLSASQRKIVCSDGWMCERATVPVPREPYRPVQVSGFARIARGYALPQSDAEARGRAFS